MPKTRKNPVCPNPRKEAWEKRINDNATTIAGDFQAGDLGGRGKLGRPVSRLAEWKVAKLCSIF